MMAKSTTLVWTAWNNGQHRLSGAGYGIKVPREDRDVWFQPSWTTVTVILPVHEGGQAVEVNIAKASFWTEACRELISIEIGKWLIARGVAPWPAGRPPRLEVVPEGVEHAGSSGSRQAVCKRANIAVEQTAGSHSLAAAAHRDRSADNTT
jgi:hypothetical protein